MIVSDGQGKVELPLGPKLFEVVDDVHRYNALIDALGAHFNVATFFDSSVQNIHSEASQDVGQVILQFSRLQSLHPLEHQRFCHSS